MNDGEILRSSSSGAGQKRWFCGWGLPCGAARNYLSGLPDRFWLFVKNTCSLALNN